MMIYERAVTKFKGDLDLWLRYAEYCRSQGNRRIKKVACFELFIYLSIFYKCSGILWIIAQTWCQNASHKC